MQEALATYVHDAGGSVGARSGKNSAILDVLHSEGELVASRDFAALIDIEDAAVGLFDSVLADIDRSTQ